MTTSNALSILGISSSEGLYEGRIVELADGDEAVLSAAREAARFLGFDLVVDDEGDFVLRSR